MILFSGLLSYTTLEGSWQNRKAEGWAWYEEKEKKLPEDNKDTEIVRETTIDEVRKILEEKLSQAILYPTDENVLSYLQEQRIWLERSKEFAQIWSKMLLANPHLDPTSFEHPSSQYGIQLNKEIKSKENDEFISSLAGDFGLFFFYEGNNRISQVFSHVIKEFSKKHKWEVLAISVDGQLLEGFNLNQVDNGIAESFSLDLFPCVMVVHPDSGHATPVAFGLSTLSQIERNILMQFKGNEVDK